MIGWKKKANKTDGQLLLAVLLASANDQRDRQEKDQKHRDQGGLPVLQPSVLLSSTDRYAREGGLEFDIRGVLPSREHPYRQI